MTGSLAASRQAKDPAFNEAGGKIDIHSITPEEVLEQANKIFSPYKLKFGAPLSWFAIWKGKNDEVMLKTKRRRLICSPSFGESRPSLFVSRQPGSSGWRCSVSLLL